MLRACILGPTPLLSQKAASTRLTSRHSPLSKDNMSVFQFISPI